MERGIDIGVEVAITVPILKLPGNGRASVSMPIYDFPLLTRRRRSGEKNPLTGLVADR
ncbi:hypothetical protein [Mesorhizobium wenxiniae]|uniref:hypothetical protein n=1 Tax=Mesorhizobium wenxiniae TaxID=2014805 RepID=UPI0013FD51C2|nr:hypothetical protein [Mesorhizobium wenxiniae]